MTQQPVNPTPQATEIAPGVWTLEHAVAEGKNAALVGAKAAWAVDTGTYAAEGQAMRAFIRAQGFPADRLLYTHGHPDHVLGSGPFLDALVVASAGAPAEIRRLLPTWAQARHTSPESLAAQIAWPTVTFSHELRLDLGSLHVRVFPTPGHSRDGVSLYVEEHRLLIAGDAVVTGIVPAIGDGDSRVLRRTLSELARLEIEILAPGHGPVVYGADAVQDWLRWIAGYLDAIDDTVKAGLARGMTPEALAGGIDFAQYVGDRLPADRHNMPRRHRATVEKIIQERTS